MRSEDFPPKRRRKRTEKKEKEGKEKENVIS